MTIAPPGGGNPEDDGPVRHPTKSPSTERAAVLPTGAKYPDVPLEAAIAGADRAQLRATREAAERERVEIVRRFPLDAWPTLPLDRYSLGLPGSADGFCRWMEFNTRYLPSIKGGSALKHMIFRRQGGDWYFERKYATLEEAWTSVRGGFVEAFRLAGEGRFEEIGQLGAIGAAISLSTKSVYCYFPEDVMPVCAGAHQEHFWRILGGQGTITKGVPGARRLLELVRQNPVFDGWSPGEVMWFLYAWADPRESQRIIKIAPGPQASLWPDCLANGYIRVGWDEVGDLREYDNRDQFSARFADAFSGLYKGNGPKITQKANELWTLLDLAQGDIIVANQGTSRVVGIGTVTDRGYEKRDDLGELTHTVGVDWDETQARDIDPIKRWAFRTIAKVSQTEYQQILKGKATDRTQAPRPSPAPVAVVDPLLREIAREVERKGQVVLYGPPGTGKTYNARRFATWWLSDQLKLASSSSVLVDNAAFRSAEESLASGPSDRRVSETDDEAASEVGQLTRVTFHPSYTYEDFVEGYKPQPTGSGSLELRLEDGVFKRVCRAARLKPDKPFLLLIDEINRGNIPKIFGELITLIERDKRGMTVTLPQSREKFDVPKNVYILGTMNTADRSIRLLDAALRRRFAFIELMPDTSLLEGAVVGGLDLALFLGILNERIAKVEGREKQIGHSFLLDAEGRPISDAEEFAAQFRHEIIPLLQEYAFEDYQELESYLGKGVVDIDSQRIRPGLLDNSQALIDALVAGFHQAVVTEDEDPA